MSNKKVIIIRNAAPQDFGGGERFPVFLSEVLTNKGFQPLILSRSKKLLTFADEREQENNKSWWWGKQQWSGIYNIFIPIYILWQVLLYLYYITVFSTQKPQAVHIQSKDDFIAATHAAYSLGIVVIWTDHADLKHIWKSLGTPFKNTVGKLVYRAAKKADTITVVSESERKFITEHLSVESPVAKKLWVVHNGVVDSAQHYPQQKADRLTFLIASRLVTDKGIGEAITAFTQLSTEIPKMRLIIIGDGPESDKFRALAEGTPSISFEGHQADPLTFMANADIFIHPTYHEGFSVALVEAGMMSLPIIATNVGGNVEIITNEETGLLVPAKNSDALYNAMKRLVEDSELRVSLGANARQQYKDNYQFNTIVEKDFIPLYGVSDEG